MPVATSNLNDDGKFEPLSRFTVQPVSADPVENGKDLFNTLVHAPYFHGSLIVVKPGEYTLENPVVIDRPVRLEGEETVDRRRVVLVGEFIICKGGEHAQFKHLCLVGSPLVFFAPVVRIQCTQVTAVRIEDCMIRGGLDCVVLEPCRAHLLEADPQEEDAHLDESQRRKLRASYIAEKQEGQHYPDRDGAGASTSGGVAVGGANALYSGKHILPNGALWHGVLLDRSNLGGASSAGLRVEVIGARLAVHQCVIQRNATYGVKVKDGAILSFEVNTVYGNGSYDLYLDDGVVGDVHYNRIGGRFAIAREPRELTNPFFQGEDSTCGGLFSPRRREEVEEQPSLLVCMENVNFPGGATLVSPVRISQPRELKAAEAKRKELRGLEALDRLNSSSWHNEEKQRQFWVDASRWHRAAHTAEGLWALGSAHGFFFDAKDLQNLQKGDKTISSRTSSASRTRASLANRRSSDTLRTKPMVLPGEHVSKEDEVQLLEFKDEVGKQLDKLSALETEHQEDITQALFELRRMAGLQPKTIPSLASSMNTLVGVHEYTHDLKTRSSSGGKLPSTIETPAVDP